MRLPNRQDQVVRLLADIADRISPQQLGHC